MLFRYRVGVCFSIMACLALTQWPNQSFVFARDSYIRELLQSLSRPVEATEPAPGLSKHIASLISRSPWDTELSEGGRGTDGLQRSLSNRLRESEARIGADWDAVVSRELFPGRRSLDRLQQTWVKLASLGPSGSYAAQRRGAALVDSGRPLSTSGSMVGDATGVYSRLEIQVERNTFEVRVFGIRGENERKLLFFCRAGLGSYEYPTPRGSYYLLRIFDDNPLWIPPPDRPWAWGQAPSHAVYGGHMMPLFDKKPVKSGKGPQDDVRDLDCVAGEMEMVDSGAYRIHGTNSPWSVGSRQSHGCVRLLNKDVKRIADLLKMYVGVTTRDRAANGTFVKLARPVRVILY